MTTYSVLAIDWSGRSAGFDPQVEVAVGAVVTGGTTCPPPCKMVTAGNVAINVAVSNVSAPGYPSAAYMFTWQSAAEANDCFDRLEAEAAFDMLKVWEL